MTPDIVSSQVLGRVPFAEPSHWPAQRHEACVTAMREGLQEVGCVNGTVGIFEDLMDSRTLFLTANTESIYAVTWLDLKDGPTVVESPPNTLGFVDDLFFNYVTDLGNAGADRG
jgi:hypothetical protein